DFHVTGVQTCALPICRASSSKCRKHGPCITNGSARGKTPRILFLCAIPFGMKSAACCKQIARVSIAWGKNWRRGRDSNPRYGFAVYSPSRRAPSTTRPPLRMLLPANAWKRRALYPVAFPRQGEVSRKFYIPCIFFCRPPSFAAACPSPHALIGSAGVFPPLLMRVAMIPRYSRPAMTALWEPESRFRIWFEIEAHACDALAELGVIPKEAAKAVWERGNFDIERIDEIEREVKHDVIAFLTSLAEFVGPEARFVHQGMTSSDVLDTCLNVQLVRAADILLEDMDELLAALKRRAFEHKMTPCI